MFKQKVQLLECSGETGSDRKLEGGSELIAMLNALLLFSDFLLLGF